MENSDLDGLSILNMVTIPTKDFFLLQRKAEAFDFLEKKMNSNTVILLEGRIPQNIIDIVKE